MKKKEILVALAFILILLALFVKYYQPKVYLEIRLETLARINMYANYVKYELEDGGFAKDSYSIVEEGKFATSIPVLLYHGISEKPYKDQILLENFEDQMFALKREGYTTVSMEEFYSFMQGEKQLPEKSILITFDDGIKSSYYMSDPIFKVLDFNAVMFIITSHSLYDGSNYYLSIREVKRMLESGRWAIESHGRDSHNPEIIDNKGSMGHFFSNRLWLKEENRLETMEEYRKRIYKDFYYSKKDLEEKLNINVIAFAFPFGDFGQSTVNLQGAEKYVLEEIQKVYSLANFYQIWPGRGFSYNFPNTKSFMIKRINVLSTWSGEDLIKELEKGKDKQLPYESDLSENSSWTASWGTLSFENQTMILGTSSSIKSGAVFLDGSFLWKDYLYKAHIKSFEGDSISLISLFHDSYNYVSCDFSNDDIRVVQVIDGKSYILAEKEISIELNSENFEIESRVEGRDIDCKIDKDKIASAHFYGKGLEKGGVSIKIFGNNGGEAKATFDKIEISALG